MGEGDGDVGEDDGGVGEDRSDDDGPRQRPDAAGNQGREPPYSSSSLTFSLDGRRVPSGTWLPWLGRGESPSRDWIYLSVSAFCSGSVLPFRVYMEIRNSDWPETFVVIFFPNIRWQHDLFAMGQCSRKGACRSDGSTVIVC